MKIQYLKLNSLNKFESRQGTAEDKISGLKEKTRKNRPESKSTGPTYLHLESQKERGGGEGEAEVVFEELMAEIFQD